MSAIDLTEARTAIARHLIADGVDFHHNTTMLAREIADIVAPIIERQVREQVAAECRKYAAGLQVAKAQGESQTAFTTRLVRAQAWFDAASVVGGAS